MELYTVRSVDRGHPLPSRTAGELHRVPRVPDVLHIMYARFRLTWLAIRVSVIPITYRSTTTERKSTPVATNCHSSDTDQHLDWTRKGGGGASETEYTRLRRRALLDFQQPMRLEQRVRALVVATTQPRAKMAWQVKIRNAPTPTPTEDGCHEEKGSCVLYDHRLHIPVIPDHAIH
ncbi:hypothetical protein HPB47_014702 [Ixodes persulcatus]|uniref:Uncharacterized protein n=1 Tax=Ixodes persulcatus TaxID=34615 RepID=A0AC60QVF6_IXOPE|nr:hypothetical protein HPB47_014702 [Ixodes persulcatus]